MRYANNVQNEHRSRIVRLEKLGHLEIRHKEPTSVHGILQRNVSLDHAVTSKTVKVNCTYVFSSTQRCS